MFIAQYLVLRTAQIVVFSIFSENKNAVTTGSVAM